MAVVTTSMPRRARQNTSSNWDRSLLLKALVHSNGLRGNRFGLCRDHAQGAAEADGFFAEKFYEIGDPIAADAIGDRGKAEGCDDVAGTVVDRDTQRIHACNNTAVDRGKTVAPRLGDRLA